MQHHSSSQRNNNLAGSNFKQCNKENILDVPVDERGGGALVTAARSQMTGSYNLFRSNLVKRINRLYFDHGNRITMIYTFSLRGCAIRSFSRAIQHKADKAAENFKSRWHILGHIFYRSMYYFISECKSFDCSLLDPFHFYTDPDPRIRSWKNVSESDLK